MQKIINIRYLSDYNCSMRHQHFSVIFGALQVHGWLNTKFNVEMHRYAKTCQCHQYIPESVPPEDGWPIVWLKVWAELNFPVCDKRNHWIVISTYNNIICWLSHHDNLLWYVYIYVCVLWVHLKFSLLYANPICDFNRPRYRASTSDNQWMAMFVGQC